MLCSHDRECDCTGDPDVYVSMNSGDVFPTPDNYTWYGEDYGADTVTILHSDEAAMADGSRVFYITVYAVNNSDGTDSTTFSVTGLLNCHRSAPLYPTVHV